MDAALPPILAVCALLAVGAAWVMLVLPRLMRRPGFERNPVRIALVEVAAAIAPYFGGRIKPPPPEPPAVTSSEDHPHPSGSSDQNVG